MDTGREKFDIIMCVRGLEKAGTAAAAFKLCQDSKEKGVCLLFMIFLYS